MTLLLILFASLAHADPFDAFVGHHALASAPTVNADHAPNGCHRYDFASLTSVDVIADRSGNRQTHTIRLNTRTGFEDIAVVPNYRQPSEVDPTIGLYGSSENDALKAVTEEGTFGYDKNEDVTVTMTASKLTIEDEIKSAGGDVRAGCYYEVDLK